MSYQVASVPFLNAKPLVWAYDQLGSDSPVRVEYAWPSKLPQILESGSVQAVLVSSIDALTTPGRVIAGGCSISSHEAVRSVKLISKVPFSEIETLALDASSMTSNALAQIILRKVYGARPDCKSEIPDGGAMLAEHDACVLIGDIGLTFDCHGFFELDLGLAWKHLTGLPFVWACWVGESGLTPDLAGHLIEARRIGESFLPAVSLASSLEIGHKRSLEYLSEVFDYRMETLQQKALAQFAFMIQEYGLSEHATVPEFVGPSYQGPRISDFFSVSVNNF